MILHTTEVMALPDCRMLLRFNNGQSGEVNLVDEIDAEVFGALRDPALFATASPHPIMRTVAWANDSDLAPRFLCDLVQAQWPQQAA